MQNLQLVFDVGYFGFVNLVDIYFFELRLVVFIACLRDRLHRFGVKLRRQTSRPSARPAGLAGTLHIEPFFFGPRLSIRLTFHIIIEENEILFEI